MPQQPLHDIGRCFAGFREVDMRYSMQLAELAVPVGNGPIDATEIGATAARFEQRYAEMFGPGSGFREAGMQAITYRVRANWKSSGNATTCSGRARCSCCRRMRNAFP